MKKLILLVTIGLVVIALAPAVAVAGDELGACLVILAEDDPKREPEGGQGNGFVCADDFSNDQCESFCGETASPEGFLLVVGCEWFGGLTCDDEGLLSKIGEPWEGACELDDKIPGGGFCALISEDLPGWTSAEICETGGGEWQGDGSVCGAPVPTLPRSGQAALMLILMLGALVILNVSGVLRSA